MILSVIFRFVVAVFAIVLTIFGLIVTISPIPFGFIIVAVGLLLFASAAPTPIRWVRKHWRGFDRFMHAIEKRLPNWMAKRLRESDYEHDDEKVSPQRG